MPYQLTAFTACRSGEVRGVHWGNYRDVGKGISLGYPLSPLMAALFLKPLDDAIGDSGLFYVRFMDDWILVAPARWKLRKAVKHVNEVLEKLLLEKNRGKTYIGGGYTRFSVSWIFSDSMGDLSCTKYDEQYETTYCPAL